MPETRVILPARRKTDDAMDEQNQCPAAGNEASSAIAVGRSKSQPAHGPQTRLGALLNPNPRRTLQVVSLALLGVWCVWWALSLHRWRLGGCRLSWFGLRPAFNADFLYVYHATRTWLAGHDPYADKDVVP